MGLERLATFGLADLRAERPLIGDSPIVAGILPKYGGRDESEMISIEVTRSMSAFAYGSSTSQPPMLTPRTLFVVELQSQETPRSSRRLSIC
jgi:hypothetical protein